MITSLTLHPTPRSQGPTMIMPTQTPPMNAEHPWANHDNVHSSVCTNSGGSHIFRFVRFVQASTTSAKWNHSMCKRTMRKHILPEAARNCSNRPAPKKTNLLNALFGPTFPRQYVQSPVNKAYFPENKQKTTIAFSKRPYHSPPPFPRVLTATLSVGTVFSMSENTASDPLRARDLCCCCCCCCCCWWPWWWPPAAVVSLLLVSSSVVVMSSRRPSRLVAVAVVPVAASVAAASRIAPLVVVVRLLYMTGNCNTCKANS